jgi:hypothetical protein
MFTALLLSFVWVTHVLMVPVCGDQSKIGLAPDPKSSKSIFTPSGIGLTVVGISLEGQDLVCRLVCVDRTGLVEPLRLRILGPLYDRMLSMPMNPGEWEIGALITIRGVLPKDIPLGASAVELASAEGRVPLGELTLYTESHLPPTWRGWFFRDGTKRIPLLEALGADRRVGLNGDVLTITCDSVPTPYDWAGVEHTFRVNAGEPVNVHLEIHDNYPSPNKLGNLEQHVYANDTLISRQDAGGNFLVGWYAVDTTFVSTTDDLVLRVEVVPIRPLAPWGWNWDVTSRTQVRNVRVYP